MSFKTHHNTASHGVSGHESGVIFDDWRVKEQCLSFVCELKRCQDKSTSFTTMGSVEIYFNHLDSIIVSNLS